MFGIFYIPPFTIEIKPNVGKYTRQPWSLTNLRFNSAAPLHLNKVYRVRASGFVPPVKRGGQEDGGLLLGGGWTTHLKTMLVKLDHFPK